MAFKRMLNRTPNPETSVNLDDTSIYSITKATPSSNPQPNAMGLGKESTVGTNAVVKTFYEDHKKGWVESRPKQLSTKTAKAYDRVAIKVYKVKDPKQPKIGGKLPLMIKSIEIQSPILVGALKHILERWGTFLEENDTAKLSAPFKPLYFAYDSIMSLYDRTHNDGVLKDHLQCLTHLMGELFGTMMTKLQNLRESRLICYDLAWTYFPKGSTLYCHMEDCERVYRVVDTKYDEGRRSFKISCEDLAFTGSDFTWRQTDLEIKSFEDNVPITSLLNYPLSFHSDPDLLKMRLAARAKLVLGYQDLKYREYVGTGLSDDCEIRRHNVSSASLKKEG